MGVVTAFAQGWLPEQVGSLANSSGSWALLAFLLARLAATPAAAAGRRLPRLRDRALSLGICALTAVAFVAVYSQGSTLFGLLS